MVKRRLGRTGYEVTEIGFGAWGLGGNMWLGVDDAEGKEALRTALDLGVTFLDTALVYGEGHSERLIGEVLRERKSDGIVVATKIPPMDYGWPGKKETPLAKTFPRAWVIECVERSLRNLGAGELQVVQFHVWHDAWLEADEWPVVRDTLALLKKEGKVLHWGVSVNSHHPETAFKLLSDPLIETVQAIYNIYDRSPERGLLELVREKDLGFIVRVPFDEGALTGAIGPSTEFPKGDWRNRYFEGDRKREVAERAERLKGLLGEEAESLSELALRFCLQRPEVATVIPGMRRAAHARANVAVSDGKKLSAGMLEGLEPFAWDKSW
jgi:aryl-alcohol dehydrogenase-like predicted oxidoreductase